MPAPTRTVNLLAEFGVWPMPPVPALDGGAPAAVRERPLSRELLGELRLLTLREARELAAWTQDELAAAAQVSRRTIVNLEAGRYVPIASTRQRLARALGLPSACLAWPLDGPKEDA